MLLLNGINTVELFSPSESWGLLHLCSAWLQQWNIGWIFLSLYCPYCFYASKNTLHLFACAPTQSKSNPLFCSQKHKIQLQRSTEHVIKSYYTILHLAPHRWEFEVTNIGLIFKSCCRWWYIHAVTDGKHSPWQAVCSMMWLLKLLKLNFLWEGKVKWKQRWWRKPYLTASSCLGN